MGDKKIGNLKGLADVLEEGNDLELKTVVEGRQGLVEQQQARVTEDCPADCHTLFLPARKVPYAPIKQASEICKYLHHVVELILRRSGGHAL